MRWIRKKILTDANQRPIAVQIEYPDWLLLERWLSRQAFPDDRAAMASVPGASNLNDLAGTLTLAEDPVDYQRRVRGEWA